METKNITTEEFLKLLDNKQVNIKNIQITFENVKNDYSYLIGKWVKCIYAICNDCFTKDKWYLCIGDISQTKAFVNNQGIKDGFVWNNGGLSNFTCFDLSNPLDHNPDEVRVFDVPSEIRISNYDNKLNLHFGEHQCLVYSKENHCYGVFASSARFEPIPCIATECKFEDLQEGDLFFATDNKNPNLTILNYYNFLDNDKKFVFTNGKSVIIYKTNYKYYFKITPKE